jgi:minor extracellular serine protease Vpr
MKSYSRLTNSISSHARITIAAALLILGAAMFSVAASGGGSSKGSSPSASTDNFRKHPVLDKSSVIVQLKGEPLTKESSTKPAQGKKIDFNSTTVKSYRAQLAARRNEFKQWLHTYAPKAKVTSEYDISLNAVAVQLNGTSLDTIKGAPMVQSVQYNALYYPLLSESHKIIKAAGAWSQAGGRANAGRGIKIGDLDTGIDETHPFFDPSGFSYPPGFPKCDAADSAVHKEDQACEHVTPKVIVAKVFYNKAAKFGLDAAAIGDHGTHTAGIAAGVTGKTAVVEGVSIDDMSGIAPGAWLGNYNVFPGDIPSARSEDILNAVEEAIADGMDVLNLSLGGGFRGNNDLLSIGLDNAVEAGVIVAVAAGNSGPGEETVESPGRARNIITVGASTNQHFVGQPLTYPAGGGTTIGAAVGDFPALPTDSYELFDTHSTGCASISADASGKLVIVDRGACTFSTKVRNAIAAGAVGVLVINNVAGDPTAMAKDGLGGDDLPAVMIGLKEGAALRASGATTASAVEVFQEFITTNADILAGFSSQGPTRVNLAVKPDVTSVGVNVLSSISCVGAETCTGDDAWAFFSGTSMATPHIAGSAAVLLDISNKGWSPARVKSALVNRADLVIKDAKTGTHDVGPTAQGGGREDLTAAANATTWLSPVAADFGKVPAASGHSAVITVFNPTANAQTFTVSKLKFTPSTFGDTIPSFYDAGTITVGDPAISVVSSFTVPAGGSYNLIVTINPKQANGVVQGWINLNGAASNDLHFAYFAHVGP